MGFKNRFKDVDEIYRATKGKPQSTYSDVECSLGDHRKKHVKLQLDVCPNCQRDISGPKYEI